jgi:DNA-directed RNA polymerase specialized sigma24 family protein
MRRGGRRLSVEEKWQVNSRKCVENAQTHALWRHSPKTGGEKRTHCRQCLSQLSAIHREVLDLVYYHEKSVDEVAAIVGAPVNTVKTRMFYARKRMANLLKAGGLK